MIPLFHQQRTDTTYDKPTYKNNAHVTYGIFLCNKVDKATSITRVDACTSFHCSRHKETRMSQTTNIMGDVALFTMIPLY